MGQEFPKFMYKGGQSVLVKDAKAEKALGGGWAEFPTVPLAAAPAGEAKEKDKKAEK